MKKIIITVCALLTVLCLSGCTKEEKLKEYTNGEIVLTLPEGMNEAYDDGDFEYSVGGKDKIVYVSSITKEELQNYGWGPLLTLADFTEEIISGDEVLLRRSFDDHEVFAYTAKVNDDEFYYLISTYETEPKFFIVNFVCFASDREKYEEAFLDYASKVTFN